MSDWAGRGGDRYQHDNEQPVEGEFFDVAKGWGRQGDPRPALSPALRKDQALPSHLDRLRLDLPVGHECEAKREDIVGRCPPVGVAGRPGVVVVGIAALEPQTPTATDPEL